MRWAQYSTKAGRDGACKKGLAAERREAWLTRRRQEGTDKPQALEGPPPYLDRAQILFRCGGNPATAGLSQGDGILMSILRSPVWLLGGHWLVERPMGAREEE